jgi:hypothetical protein
VLVWLPFWQGLWTTKDPLLQRFGRMVSLNGCWLTVAGEFCKGEGCSDVRWCGFQNVSSPKPEWPNSALVCGLDSPSSCGGVRVRCVHGWRLG